jgi:hypothetical protein
MKIIEAMKRVKQNGEKIADLQSKIAVTCANLSVETPVYGSETKNKINEWSQGCDDLTQENIRLLTAIQRTNLVTPVTIELGMKTVTKNIAEWVWRRRTYAAVDLATWSKMTDRNLKEGQINQSTGQPLMVTIVRHYDPEKRDAMMAMYRSEPHMIDAALEVINATTDLIEA